MSLTTILINVPREVKMKRTLLIFAAILAFSALAMAQSPLTCQAGIEPIVGTYLVSSQGYLTMPDPNNPYATPVLFPGAILGVMSIDSNGKLSGTSTVAGLSDVAEYESNGTVTLKADCTGVLKFTNTNKKTKYADNEEDKFIVVISGYDVEIHSVMVNVNNGIVPVLISNWKRIAYKTNAAIW